MCVREGEGSQYKEGEKQKVQSAQLLLLHKYIHFFTALNSNLLYVNLHYTILYIVSFQCA